MLEQLNGITLIHIRSRIFIDSVPASPLTRGTRAHQPPWPSPAARVRRAGGQPRHRVNMVQKWLGHAQLTTTAIYANAVGEEEQSIAARMWYGGATGDAR